MDCHRSRFLAHEGEVTNPMHQYDSTLHAGDQQVIRLHRSMIPLDPTYEPEAPIPGDPLASALNRDFWEAGDTLDQFFDATRAHSALIRCGHTDLAEALLARHDATDLAHIARQVAPIAAGEDTNGDMAGACGSDVGALTALALWLARTGTAGCDATGVASASPSRDRVDAEWAAAVASFLTGDDAPIL
jgi:hypothetical protein